MRIITVEPCSKIIELGRYGENEATAVYLPLAEFQNYTPGGTFSVLVRRPDLGYPSPVEFTISEGYAVWNVGESFLAVEGYGKLELRYAVNGTHALGRVWNTHVGESIIPQGETAPDPFESWYENILEAGDRAEAAEGGAEQYAETARGYAEDAETAKEAIENMTVSAHELPAGSQPTVEKTTPGGVVNLEFGIPAGSGGGGGTDNYNDLQNKPAINGSTLSGNMTGAQLGLVDAVPGKGLSSNDFTSDDKAKIGENSDAIAQIEDVIPEQASSNNQLADKQFVNSSIQTSTAHYRGPWATWAAVPADAALYPADDEGVTTPTSNDYLVVQNAADYPVGTGENALVGTWRFKYSGLWATNGKNGWHPEYQVNEEPLTAAQIAALNSGVTAAAVQQIGDNASAISGIKNGSAIDSFADVEAALDGKPTVTANPTLAGTEAALTGLEVGDIKYKVESGMSQADADNRYLKLSGGTMSGDIKMPSTTGITSNAGDKMLTIENDGSGITIGGYRYSGNVVTLQVGTSGSAHVRYGETGTVKKILDESNTSANPTLSGGETTLASLKLNGVNYAIPSGGGGEEVHLYEHRVYGYYVEGSATSRMLTIWIYNADATPITTEQQIKDFLDTAGAVSQYTAYPASGIHNDASAGGAKATGVVTGVYHSYGTSSFGKTGFAVVNGAITNAVAFYGDNRYQDTVTQIF